jgi:multiple sugar transport system permease protein
MKYSKYTPYLFLIPMILGLAFFRLIPIGISFLASFTSWNIYSPPIFVGIDNYKEIINSSVFWKVFNQTIQFSVIFTLGVCVIGLLFAVLLNEKMKGISFFRGLFFLPVVTSVVAIGIVFSWILSPEIGILNNLLSKVFDFSERPSWLGDQKYALYSLTMVYVWKTVGYQMIIYLSGLQSIPRDLNEAARIDGANSFQSFFFVTLPLLTPTVFFVLVITIIESFNTFGITHSMTQGGPYNSTNTLSYFIFQNAFVHFRMGYASSLAYVLFLITLVVTYVNFLYKKKWVNYQ